jgi:hypothetical protein
MQPPGNLKGWIPACAGMAGDGKRHGALHPRHSPVGTIVPDRPPPTGDRDGRPYDARVLMYQERERVERK